MNTMNPFLATDGYKTGHMPMYPDGTSSVYSNFTPRSLRHAPTGVNQILVFGTKMGMMVIDEMFNDNFFLTKERKELTHLAPEDSTRVAKLKEMRDRVCGEIQREYSNYLNMDYDVSHIEALWDLGYLPIKVKSLPEGTLVNPGIPVLTIQNTIPEFFWLTNFLETILSNLLWKPMTSATIALQYKRNLTKWALRTDKKNVGFVNFQGHDFSMRGLDSVEATISSGLGHAISFMGSDSLPVIYGARKYYGADGFVVGSVNATEHSVMCAGTKEDEIGTFRRLMNIFPNGVLSIVSDTWNLWDVVRPGGYVEQLKEEILAREGKVVIRPDSGNPVDIICGHSTDGLIQEGDKYYVKGKYISHKDQFGSEVWGSYEKGEEVTLEERKGVIELLWDIFGGIINEQGYKVLDEHIGAIYGDSITIDRAEQICERLEAKGFATTNVVLGIGSFTYQFNTRDTFGFAMKATYVELMEKNDELVELPVNEDEGNLGEAPETYKIIGREIFKDPITDDGRKKSARGLLMVGKDENGEYFLKDQATKEEEEQGCLETIYLDGKLTINTTLDEIRARVNELV